MDNQVIVVVTDDDASASITQALDSAALATPKPYPNQTGLYLTSLHIDGDKTLCLQLPACKLKTAVSASSKNKQVELLYDRKGNETVNECLEQIMFVCQQHIYNQKEKWFQSEFTMDDLDNMMQPIVKLGKGGSKCSVKATIVTKAGVDKTMGYTPQNGTVDIETLDVSHEFIPLLAIDGIKFTSKTFEVELRLMQFMMLTSFSQTNMCKIKTPGSNKHAVAVAAAAVETTPVEIANATVELDAAPIDTASVDIVDPASSASIENVETASVEPAPAQAPVTASVEPAQATVEPSVEPAQAPVEPAPIDPAPVETALAAPAPASVPELQEIELTIDTVPPEETVHLKQPNEVYYDIYRKARQKAKELRRLAMTAYLEANEIKTRFMLDDLDDESDEDELDDESSQGSQDSDDNESVQSNDF
jgi:hypothetical protein